MARTLHQFYSLMSDTVNKPKTTTFPWFVRQWRSKDFFFWGGGGQREVGIFLKVCVSNLHFCTLNVMGRGRLCVVAQTNPVPFFFFLALQSTGGAMAPLCPPPLSYTSVCWNNKFAVVFQFRSFNCGNPPLFHITTLPFSLNVGAMDFWKVSLQISKKYLVVLLGVCIDTL